MITYKEKQIFNMNSVDKQYKELLQHILENGKVKGDRTGTGTISIFGHNMRFNMSEGFTLLTTKKMFFKGIITELIWFLKGDTNIKYLLDNNCHIWDGDAYKNFITQIRKKHSNHYEPISKEEFINRIKTDDEFAKKWGELGPVYGKQWRDWNGIDQIQNLINDLKTNPDSRRLMVNAWNVGELDQMVLPPCHYGFQVWTRELSLDERKKLANYDSEFVSPMTVESWDRNNIPTRAISLMWNQRSVDTPLGLPFNIASYALLLTIVGKLVNMIPDELITNMGDCHIYLNQVDGVKEQLEREPYQLPTLKINSGNENWHLLELDEVLDALDPDTTFKIENYQSHPTIKFPLSN